jgi:hypothetical protein
VGHRVVIQAGDGAGRRKREGAAPSQRAAPSRRRTSTWWEVMHPEGSQGTWRDLPRLLVDSLRLVWSAGRNIFLLTAVLQLVAVFGIAVQLFVGKARR